MNVTIEFTDASTTSWTPDILDCQRWINEALLEISNEKDSTVSLRFVDADESSQLNNDYRGKEQATNVLSFPANLPEELSSALESMPLGDIVVCPQIVTEEAELQSKALQAHWAHMLIHGVLHLSGFDHESDAEAKQMEAHEINVLEKLGFPNPYLIG
jgi:probable rRNA maturation factor